MCLQGAGQSIKDADSPLDARDANPDSAFPFAPGIDGSVGPGFRPAE